MDRGAETGRGLGGEPREGHQPTGARSIVWMVNMKTGMSGRKGHLSMEPGVLVFHPDSTRYGDTRIRFEHVRRAKAARFTPVLDLRLEGPDLPQRMGFYFAEPPSTDPIERSGLDLSTPRRRAQREAAASLRDADLLVRQDLEAWVTRIERERRKH
jgi:hypothetical protein